MYGNQEGWGWGGNNEQGWNNHNPNWSVPPPMPDKVSTVHVKSPN